MRRAAVFSFGVVSYAIFFASFAYGILFVGNVSLVPRTIDSGGPSAPVWLAATIDALLIVAFGVHHSVAARGGFKKRVPQAIERNTYVLVSSLLLIVTWWQWRPIPALLWNLGGWLGTIVTGVFWMGWALAIASTFAISHFDLFGLRHAMLALQGKPYEPLPLETPALYRLVRHPLMLGLLIAFWAAPAMSAGHLLFSAGMSAYILIGVAFEERDLQRAFGDSYTRYRQSVPSLLPLPRPKAPAPE